jgi:hypothetical protein
LVAARIPKYAVVIVEIAVNAAVRMAAICVLSLPGFNLYSATIAAAAIATSPATTTISPVQARATCTRDSLVAPLVFDPELVLTAASPLAIIAPR